jgi:hypothetical protein
MIIPSQHASRVARAAAGGGGADVTPNALNWTGTLGVDDISPYQDYTEQQILGINQAITLTFTVTATSGTPPTVQYRKQSTATSSTVNYGGSGNQYGGTPTPTGTHSGGSNGFANLYDGSTLVVSSLSVSSGDYLAFLGYGNAPPFGTNNVTIRINNQSDANVVLDTIIFNQESACVLTTAVVRYMGGLDNGTELTAMRMLREHYSSVEGYTAEIQDYYTNSPLIVSGINNSSDKDAIYLEIYATVKTCESFVMTGQWEQAHDQYMTMYLGLKGRFVQ